MSGRISRRFLYSLRAVLAGVVLYYAVDLSRGDRGAIDYAVLGLVIAALAWNLVRLVQRLHRARGAKEAWHTLRTLGFWAIGLLNTVAIRPEDAGSWKNWVGWLVVALAAADTVHLILIERAVIAELPGDEEEHPLPDATD